VAVPLSPADIEALRKISTPTMSNAIETFNVRPRSDGFVDSSVRCILPELGVMVGYAYTLTIRASREEPSPSPLDVWKELLEIPEPRVVVIQDLDAPNPIGSYWGEVNGNIHKALGCVGTVTNGGVRDLDEVRELGFHLFASCVLVSHAYVHVVEFGKPVRIGGLTVKPGDLIHADKHGVLRVPPEIARDLPKAAADFEAKEREIISFCQSPEFSPQKLLELRIRQLGQSSKT
jgi:4-hydroxy-4-methyl-2-oxoglutarate aldolase